MSLESPEMCLLVPTSIPTKNNDPLKNVKHSKSVKHLPKWVLTFANIICYAKDVISENYECKITGLAATFWGILVWLNFGHFLTKKDVFCSLKSNSIFEDIFCFVPICSNFWHQLYTISSELLDEHWEKKLG